MDFALPGWNAHWRDLFEQYTSRNLTIPGRIAAEYRGAFRVEAGHRERAGVLAGRLRHQATCRSELPAVGDFVALRMDGGDGPAVIETVLPRRTALVRRAAGGRPEDQIIAANLDTVFVMLGLDGDFNVRRVERYLAAVWESGATPVVLLNKADVCHDAASKRGELQRAAIGVEVYVISARGGDALDPYLGEGATVGMVGSSGVGKSTLLNRLLKKAVQSTYDVRAHDSRGRHTTTHRQLFVVPQGGCVIDTPGMREFQLAQQNVGLDLVFADVEALAASCRFADCAHVGEPGCAVRDAVERGTFGPARLASYEKLVQELRYEESRDDPSAASERKRIGRIGAKAIRRMERDRRRSD